MEVKSNYGQTRPQLENESLLVRMQTELKNIIFRVFFLMLKDEEQSITVAALLQTIMFLQYLSLLFYRQLYIIWKNEGVSYELHELFGYLMLTPYFEMLEFSSFASMMYVLIGIILIAIMILLLVGYSNTIKLNTAVSWPVFILKQLFILFSTILYLPTLNLFFEMVNCHENDQNIVVLQAFDQECWNGAHIVHGIVAILGILIFVIFTAIFNLLYFEARPKIKDLLSKQSGRAKTFVYFYLLVMQMSIIILDPKDHTYIIIYIILVGAFISFYKLHIEQPYYNQMMQKVVSIYSTLILWSALLLCFSNYLEDNIFHGTIYAWLVGLPLLALAVFKKQKYHYDLLLMNISKVDDPNQIIKLINYIQTLLTGYQNNQQFNIMLNALIDVHKNTCQIDDCVFKNKKQINLRIIQQKDEDISQRDYNIYLLLGEIYSRTMRKHSTHSKLRINYAFYLLDYLKQRQQALNELIQAETLCPSLDNEFTIFRYKQIIEYEMNAAQNENFGNLDVASELAFQNYMKSFQNKIERATLMHMDFWSQLQEDSPDLGKMNDIGAKINLAIIQVEELWNKMQKMTSNLPKAMRLYAKFIIEVLQDKDYGEELLEKAKFLQIQNSKMKNKSQIQIFNVDDINFESLPTLIVSVQNDKFAQISNLNLSACNLLGYHKTELLNRRINMIIPTIYAKFHDQYIDGFFEKSDASKISKEKFVYLKLKSGYIQPCYLQLKMLQTAEENSQLIVQFRSLRNFKSACYIILDADESIESLSSSCICNIFIDHKVISHKKIFIQEIFPNYNRNDYLNKIGCKIALNLSTELIQNSYYIQYYINDLEDQTQIEFQIQVTEIENEKIGQIFGYVIKLEKVTEIYSQQFTPELLQQLAIPNQSVSSFQFKYFANKALYVGENQDDINSARVDQTVIWEYTSRTSEETQEEKKIVIEDNKIAKPNYAEGIRTLKLFENRIQDLEDIKLDFSEQEEEQHSSVFQRHQDSQEEIEFGQKNNMFRNRKALNSAINNQQIPKIMVYLSWVINILVLAVITLTFTSYFLGLFLFQNFQDSLNLLGYATTRNLECNQIVMNIQNLQMLNLGIWNLTEVEATDYEIQQRTELNESIFTLTQVNKKLMLSDIYINSEIEELHSQRVVNVRINKNSYQKYDLIEATQQIISKALIVRDKQLSQINKEDEDTSFILYNLFNDIVFQLRNETGQYSYGLQSVAEDNALNFFIILIVSGCSFIILLIFILLFLMQINQTKEQILQLFIEIPEKTVKYLYNKSENFISNLQIGEEEEISSEVSDEENDEEKELNKSLKSKRRKKLLKNKNSFFRTQFTLAIFLVSTLIGYFILNYFLNQTTYSNLKQQIPELNITARSGSFYRYVDNSERQLFLNRDDPILLQDAYTSVVNNLQQNYDLDSSLHSEHAKNSEICNSDYYDTFQQIFMMNPCNIFIAIGYSTQEYCEAYASGSIQQGMAVAIARFFENVRYIMTIYDVFYGYPDVNFTAAARGSGVFRNITQNSDNVTNYIYNLNNFKQAQEARVLQSVFIKGAFIYLVDQYIIALKDDISLTQTQLLAIFIVFEVLVFLVYFIGWYPASIRMTRDIWRTKGLIMMIPLNVILKIKSIKEKVGNLVQGTDQ
ncbi:unnamed protein product (macronuclear) [Paramecium tetraurelia]|uniref:TmcB/TmcC TPR repeats domain-containing protein n=1 Tax=Paramecium tetraurelia TaxID=5888 RepID=A0DI23_PARTE|nr:uncharacterized protein GSPATT00017061001 [Paramecium tetraurelia]CAK82690.1 unnamed protein product [Paramecium tetraurelia]|eukprot:XP_001450087.1 hypothetical protein (macronuclear) [Paramecium tetraurelia strain d4-2]